MLAAHACGAPHKSVTELKSYAALNSNTRILTNKTPNLPTLQIRLAHTSCPPGAQLNLLDLILAPLPPNARGGGGEQYCEQSSDERQSHSHLCHKQPPNCSAHLRLATSNTQARHPTGRLVALLPANRLDKHFRRQHRLRNRRRDGRQVGALALVQFKFALDRK